MVLLLYLHRFSWFYSHIYTGFHGFTAISTQVFMVLLLSIKYRNFPNLKNTYCTLNLFIKSGNGNSRPTLIKTIIQGGSNMTGTICV
jgi:hypothetical protein